MSPKATLDKSQEKDTVNWSLLIHNYPRFLLLFVEEIYLKQDLEILTKPKYINYCLFQTAWKLV